MASGGDKIDGVDDFHQQWPMDSNGARA